MVWLNAMMVLIQVAQLVALALAAAAGGGAGDRDDALGALGLSPTSSPSCTASSNPLIVLGAVVLTAIVLFFGTAMLFAILGITPQETS